MKKQIQLIPLLLLSLSLSSCGIPTWVKFDSIYQNKKIVELHDEYQMKYFASPDYRRGYSNILKKNSTPLDFNLTWDCESDGSLGKTTYTVEVSKDRSFASQYKYQTASIKSITLTNLEIDTEYYYRINARVAEDTYFDSDVYSFKTCNDGLRLLNVEGVKNIRDLGGYTFENNKTFRQGMIFRSAQFNYDEDESNPIKSKPTEKGLKVLNEELKIKSDIDIRDVDETDSITASPLGENVNYLHLPMKFGGNNIFTNDYNKESIKSFFEYCSEETSYPLVFHCSRGADRTGALAYALGAICGLPEERLLMDYYFTGFGGVGSLQDINGTKWYPYQISNTEGDSLQEKTMNYLINNIGVSKTTLDKIVDILVTPKLYI